MSAYVSSPNTLADDMLGIGSFFQETILDPVNNKLGIGKDTFKTGDPKLDAFIKQQGDKIVEKGKEEAKNYANDQIKGVLNKGMTNSSSNSNSNDETSQSESLANNDLLYAGAGAVAGGLVTKYAVKSKSLTSLLIGAGVGAGVGYATKKYIIK